MKVRRLAVVVGLMLAGAVHAAATSGVAVRVTPVEGTEFSASDSGSGGVEVRGGASGGGGAIGEASAFADFGIIKLKGSAVGPITAASSGSFGDVLTITSPDVFDGTQGNLGVSVVVEGTVSGTPGALSNWRLKVEVPVSGGSFTVIDKSGVGNDTGYIGDPFGFYSGTIPFVYGKPFFFSALLLTSAFSPGSATAADYDFSRSVYWDGVSNVTARGLPVGTIDIASESGNDYRLSFVPPPVPEPEIWAMMLLGTGLVGFQVRRKAKAAEANWLTLA